MPRAIEPALMAKLAAEYGAGEPCTAVAKRHAVSNYIVLKAARKAGVAVRSAVAAAAMHAKASGKKWGSLRPETVLEAAELYRGGATIRQLALHFGVHFKTMQVALKKMEVAFRPPRGVPRCVVDHGAFETPTAAGHYWAGLLYADGCVYGHGRGRQQQVIKLQLSGDDGRHIVSFAEFLKTDYPVRSAVPSCSFGGSNVQDIWFINVRSDRLAADLATYGVVPNKSLVASVPEHLRLNADWWRGVVCGDGWVRITNGPKIGLCGTEATIRQFSGFVQHVAGGDPCDVRLNGRSLTNWRTEIGGRRALAVVRALFGHGGPALPRKANTAAEIMRRWADEPDRGKPLLKYVHKKNRLPPAASQPTLF